MNITLMGHQKDALAFMANRKFTALFYETGTGKTPIGLEAAEQWYLSGLRRVVCIVPNSLTGNWLEEAQRFEFALRAVRTEGPRARKIDLIESDEWDFLITNYESARTMWQNIVATRPQGLIMDELQRVKDRKSAQSKGCRQIANAVKRNGGRILGLTGTPVVNKPFDLWSEFDILWPSDKPLEHVLGYGNYYAFESGIAYKWAHPTLRGVSIYQFPPDRLAVLKERVSQHAIEKSKEDCLDLPGRSWQELRIDMSEEQSRVYTSLKSDMIAFLGGDESVVERNKFSVFNMTDIFLDDPKFNEDRRVSVTFATTLMIRLHQIASGFVPKDDGKILEFENPKLQLLREFLPGWTDSGWKNKVLIFHRYTHDRVLITKLLDELKIGYVTLSGQNSSEAADIVRKFQTDDDVRVFVGNVQVASVGITLTAANYVVFYNNSFQLEHRLQAQDRAYRIGQTRKVTYYDLITRNTVDERVLANLKEKKQLAAATVKDLLQLI